MQLSKRGQIGGVRVRDPVHRCDDVVGTTPESAEGHLAVALGRSIEYFDRLPRRLGDEIAIVRERKAQLRLHVGESIDMHPWAHHVRTTLSSNRDCTSQRKMIISLS
jgi:hypothetical protein